MNPQSNLPPVGHYAGLREYIEYLRRYSPRPEIAQGVSNQLKEILDTGDLCSIVVQETFPESMVDPDSKDNPWFVMLKRAVVYNLDLSAIVGVVENHLTHFTFSRE